MNRAVIYLDTKGQEHEALVFAVNPLNEGFVSLVYVDESKPEADNVVKLIDVRHMATISEARLVESDEMDYSTGKEKLVEEGNKHLPTYHLNCWKEPYESHNPLPVDHPAYDHPHRKVVDQDGNVIPVPRPEYDAEVAAHQYATGTSAPPPPPDIPSALPTTAQKAGLDDQVRENHLAHLKAVGEAEAAKLEDAKVADPKDETIAEQAAEIQRLQAELADTTEGRDKALQALADEQAKKQPSEADLDAVARRSSSCRRDQRRD